MFRRMTYPAVGLLSLLAMTASAQQVRVMQWNCLGGLGDSAGNNTAQARAIARIINYNQPDILLFNEVESHSVQSNVDSFIDFVTNNIPYLGTQPGVTFHVAVSSLTDGFNRNAAISRYPILGASTYDDGLRGLHSFRVQLTGTNVLQVFHTHLKCCADDCTRKQTEAQFDADVMSGWALTNAGPYIYAGDLNEDEENPVCTLSSTYHPITTIREDGGVVEFKPTTLSGEHRTWSTTSASIRFDYILAATNRLTPAAGIVFSTMDQAAHGLYTNASPQNLVNDSQTASDHYCVLVDYVFPTAAPGIVVTPTNDFASAGNQGGPFAPASQVYNLANTNGSVLNWSVTKSASWLALSATNGALTGGANTNITVSIAGAANSLVAGTYGDTVAFHDLTAGASVSRVASLMVLGPPTLSVSPAGAFNSSGITNGPFNPSSQTYTLSNTGNGALNWTANFSAAWLTVAPLAGALASGASTTVVATLNASANALPEGVYTDTIGFTNTTNGAGNTTRAVNLSVNSSAFGFADNFAKFAAGNLVGQNNWTQLGATATLPLQVSGGQVVIPYAQSVDNQDAYKSFALTNMTVFYGMTVTISNAPSSTSSPSYFSAMTLSNSGTGFANYRLAARRGNAANTNYVFGIRITGETADGYTYGAGLPYLTECAVIVEADAGGAVMKLFVNPTSSNLGSQTAYLTHNNGGTPPATIGSFLISQYASGTAPNAGLSIGKAAVADTFAGVYNALFAPAHFTVTPASALSATGPQGGPFTPATQVYTLNNTNAATLSWSVSKNATWLTLDATSGTLPGGASTNITVSINNAANFLSPGIAQDAVTFTDVTTGGTVTRNVGLTVQALANLVVSPASAYNATGIQGGPFSPATQNFTVSNSGSLTMNWAASRNAAWLNLAPTNGTLAGGASVIVTASVNATANSLAPGSYNDTIAFTNTTNSAGTAGRTANLTVIDPSAAGFFDDVEAGTNGWTASGLWHVTSDASACTFAEGHSPSRAWWYGQESTCNYRTCGGCTNFGSLVSPPFVVPASGTLTFWSREDTEGTGTVNDQRIVYISTNAGVAWVQLFQSTNDAQTWYQVTNSLAAFAGKTAQLRFYFNANSNNNRFSGWLVDDVLVIGSGALTVTPSSAVNAAGEQGGPFAPGAQTYTLGNTGGSALSWTTSVSNNWLSLSATSGSIAAGGSTNVTVTTNANVNALVGGLYSNVVSFVNVTSGAGNANLLWTLLVRDGIADAWRQTYFGHADPRADDLSRAQDDADGDGLSNLAEYVFGSVPTDAGNAFQLLITPAGSGVQLSFPSLTGRLYTLEINDALGAGGSWLPVGAFTDVAGDGSVKIYTDSLPPATRAYRLRGRIGP